jgi:2-amino-4-hydroxy-6-hydroxymethyldihydropteridine diphosphokinase
VGRDLHSQWAKTRAWIAFGANLPSVVGTPLETLRAAVRELEDAGVTVTAVSRVYETPCFPAGAGPDYVNFVAEVQSADAPEELLQTLHMIEARFGRVRKLRWAGRSIDLDLLAVEQEIRPDVVSVRAWITLPFVEQSVRAPDQLILPHPRIQDRAFMLIPFADLAADWRHPILDKTVREMLDARPTDEKSEIKLMPEVEILTD